MLKRTTIKCSKCNKTYDVEINNKQNVSKNPDYRTQILSGETFNFECPHCHNIESQCYRLEYIDPVNKFIVYLDQFDDLIQLKARIDEGKENPNHDKKWDEYRYWGATSHLDLANKIIVLEKGLDPRLVYLLGFDIWSVYKKNCEKNNEPIPSIKYCQLEYEEDELYFVYHCEENTSIHIKYTDDLYNNIKESKYAKMMLQLDNFVFDSEAFIKFLDQTNGEDKDLETLDLILGLVVNDNNLYHVCYIPSFSAENFDVGDEVVCEDTENFFIGIITKIFKVNHYKFPRISFPWIARRHRGYSLKTTRNSFDKLDNSEIMKLLKISDEDTLSFTFEYLKNAEFIYPINIENFDDEMFDSHSAFSKDNFLDDDCFTNPLMYEINNKRYLCIFSDQENFNYNHKYAVGICKFDDIVKYYSHGMNVDGIIINPDSDKFILSYADLNDYLMLNVCDNHKKVCEVLCSLSDAEIDFMNRDLYEFMYTYYFSKLSKKDFMEKYDFSREAFDIAYNCGIEKLKDIVRIKGTY